MKLPLLSLYIHIPWCLKKCPYCDFYSKSIKIKKIPQKKYIQNLILDLDKNIKFIQSRKIHSIFIGGGTPNLIKPKYIKYLMKEIKKRTNFDKKIEITLESNPNSIKKDYFFKYKSSGINRLSLGIQSFNEKILNKINRNYTFKELIETIQIIKKINFNQVNFDLMYSLPLQKKKEAIQDLKYAIKFKPSHISWYQLCIEPKTFFYKKTPKLPNENESWKMFVQGHKKLKKKNFIQYEISAYAKKNNQCKHNLNYWKFGDYLGIGCGAHGKITLKNGKILRTFKNKNINEFLQGKYTKKIIYVKKKNLPFEFFLNNFRLNKPCKKKDFEIYTGIKKNKIKKTMQKAIKKKYIIENKKFWKKTKKGKLFLNDLLELFLKI